MGKTLSESAVPFMSMGYVVTHEQGILCVMNESLKERFKMN
jgi:hypothetical protein